MTNKELEEIFANLDFSSLAESPFDTLTRKLGLREVTTEELSLVLGLSDRRISQMWQDGILPEPRFDGKRNWYPLLDSLRAYIDFLRDR